MSTARAHRRHLITAAAALLAACASPQRGARIEPAANVRPMDGTVAVLTTLTGDACRDREECAQRQAVRAVLFTGVPDSPVTRPMVPDEQAAVRSHKAYFEELIDRGGFRRYVVRVTPQASGRDTPQSFVVLLNTDALRSALEKAGVIRRFGF